MPPKDYIPPVLCIQLSDGSFEEIQNIATVGEIETWAELHEFVKVTRCRYCKYYKTEQLKSDYTPDKRYKPSVCTKGKFAVHRDPDWYCADGKRREE